MSLQRDADFFIPKGVHLIQKQTMGFWEENKGFAYKYFHIEFHVPVSWSEAHGFLTKKL